MASSRRPLPPPEVEKRLRAQFGEDILEFADQDGHSVATVAPQRYREVATFLRDDPDLALDFFDFTGGVDFAERGIQVVTHLFSTTHHHNVRLRVWCDKDSPRCPTLSDVYPGANWHERETAEMFGVVFEGHPQPVKLLLSEEFEGNPLRKDFPLMTREAKPWPGAAEGEEEEE